MKNSTVLLFGRCEIRLAQRELRVEGQVRAVEPRAYRFLTFLLQESGRAVAKREIVDAVWRPGAVLSNSVLARTAMLARRAIGDDAASEGMIRTVRGFGYRFVGEVIEAPADSEPQWIAQPSPPASRLRIGVLPCDNRSGEAALDWIGIGLMALVVQALVSDSRLQMMPVAAMLDIVRRAGADSLVDERARQATDHLGLAYVVHAALRREDGALWLDWQLFGEDQRRSGAGSLRDSEAVTLCKRLALAIEAAMFPGSHPRSQVASGDPFVDQAFARGVELLDQEQFQGAAALLSVACYLAPDNLAAQLANFRAQVRCGSPDLTNRGEALIARAAAVGDRYTLTSAYVELVAAELFWQAEAPPEVRLRHQQEAIRLSAEVMDDDLTIRICSMLAIAEWEQGHTERAFELMDQAQGAARAASNNARLSNVMHNRAIMNIMRGDLVSAKQELEEASQLYNALREEWQLRHCLTDLAMLNAQLGQFKQACELCDRALQTIGDFGAMPRLAYLGSAMAFVFADCGAVAGLKRVRARFPEAATQSGHPCFRPMMALEGVLALSRGDAAAARQRFQDALAPDNDSTLHLPFLRIWRMVLLRQEVVMGDFEGVDRVCAQMKSSPGYAADPAVRGCVMRAQAAHCLQQGDRDGALAMLLQIIEQLPFGREVACSRLDAAWLCVEAGDTNRAEGLLSGAGAWRQEHFAGVATEARLLFELRRHADAAKFQDRAIGTFSGVLPEFHRALLEHYLSGSDSGPPPRSIRLASEAWLA